MGRWICKKVQVETKKVSIKERREGWDRSRVLLMMEQCADFPIYRLQNSWFTNLPVLYFQISYLTVCDISRFLIVRFRNFQFPNLPFSQITVSQFTVSQFTVSQFTDCPSDSSLAQFRYTQYGIQSLPEDVHVTLDNNIATWLQL